MSHLVIKFYNVPLFIVPLKNNISMYTMIDKKTTLNLKYILSTYGDSIKYFWNKELIHPSYSMILIKKNVYK